MQPAARTTSTSSLSRALSYPKFERGRAPRMLVMDSNYFLVGDVIQCARKMGWQVECLPTQISGKANAEDLKELLFGLVNFRPDFVFTVNHIGFDEAGTLAGTLDDLGMPLASWFVDHPLPILGGAEQNARSNTQVFCYERTALPWLERFGFEEPDYLPTASNAEHFSPSQIDRSIAQRMGQPLALVGGSWWKRARIDVTPESTQLANDLAVGRNIDRKFLRDELARILDQNAQEHGRALFNAAQIALAEASMKNRAEFVLALAEHSPVVYGDEHWANLLQGIELRGLVHPTQELPSLFAGTDVNLNITAVQMPTALNQRIWDVPGAGGFLLTDAQTDLFEYFECGVDIATYGCLEEAKEKAAYYLEHESAREKITERAHSKIERYHRTHHRLQQIEDVMRKRF